MPVAGALVRPKLIFADLPPTDGGGVLRELAERVAAAGAVRDAGALYRALVERERLGSTGIGGGVAIPHCKLPGLSEGILAVGIVRPPVDFGAADGAPVALFFLVLSPEGSPAEHLQTLARISRWVRSGGHVEKLLRLDDPGAIYDFLKESVLMQNPPPAIEPAPVKVRELLGEELASLNLRVLSGESHLDNHITHPRVQKPGLAFAGYFAYIKPGRVQIVGESETEYMMTLDEAERLRRFDVIASLPVPVFVITKGLPALPGFLESCQQAELPVLSSTALSSTVIKAISYFLEDHLVPSTCLHGVLLDIYGLGVLLIGDSGVGKSESALDLITRGHSLVADDRVYVKRYPSGELVGFSEGPLRLHMELRGIGIINVQDLFGLASVRERKPIDLVIELEHWQAGQAYDRLGLDESVFHILDVPCPYIRMPVAMGRNVGILVEIAARNHVLKQQGHHSAREFARKLEAELERNRKVPAR